MRKLIILAIFFFASSANADTVYLKNGGVIEGIIGKEDENKVEVNMGFGTVTFNKSQVKSIEKSSAESSYNMAKGWEEKRKELRVKEKEFNEARDKRFKEAYKNWMDEARAKRSGERGETKDIQTARDESGRHIVVEVLLNDKVKATLLLDTGASLVVLSKRIGEELGLETGDATKDIMVLKLADGRMSNAKAVVLDSVKIEDVEAKKVIAAVMLDQLPDPALRDGLLGMSFLSRFNIKMDLTTMKMSLERLEKQEEPR